MGGKVPEFFFVPPELRARYISYSLVLNITFPYLDSLTCGDFRGRLTASFPPKPFAAIPVRQCGGVGTRGSSRDSNIFTGAAPTPALN